MLAGKFKICSEWYSAALFAEYPAARFVFGDNAERWGRGGQAAVCRDHPQAIGVATLWAPGRFFTDCLAAREIVFADLAKIVTALDAGHDVYWPAAGIGTGLAQLKRHAPGIFSIIEDWRDRALLIYD